MANRAVMQCINNLLRKLTGNSLPFGGKIFACAGDFRQTCPVIRQGSQAQVVDASIRSSPLWAYFTIRRLTAPMRNVSDPAYAAYMDWIGDGAGPEVPLPCLDVIYDLEDIISFVYPDVILQDPAACLT